MATSSEGEESASPGLMSRTREVPRDVPSLRQSSTPLLPSSAAK